jgi:hypothetical protein
MIPSEAIEAVTRIIKRYPSSMMANVGDGYIGAIAETLASYPKQVALACADRRGITSGCKFPPSDAEIIAWCEKHIEPLRLQVERERRITEQLAERKRFEDLAMQSPRPAPGRRVTYGEFLEMAARGEVNSRPIGRFEK